MTENMIFIDSEEGGVEIRDDEVERASMYALKRIVQRHQFEYLTWGDAPADLLLVDMTTARMLIAVHDALSPSMQKLFEQRISASRTWLLTLVDFGWRHVT